MKQSRILILFAAVPLLTGVTWLLFVRPEPVDMAQFAPADSLLYLEANKPAEVLRALTSTDVWRSYNPAKGTVSSALGGWWQSLLRATAIGPIDSVILARAQAALVVTNLGATESGETLRVRPEAALILETHTSERRIRGPIQRTLEGFVSSIYSNPKSEHSVIDGVSIVEWRDRNGGGQLVAAFLGTVVIVGNSRHVVETCLSVARRRSPSLMSDSSLHHARSSQNAANALLFGYVPERESPRLISAGIPILLGRAPTDDHFQRLIQTATSKLVRDLTWTARPFRGGIEDRYEIALQPDFRKELTAPWGPPQLVVAPAHTDFYSSTEYRFSDPLAAWQGLKTSISSHVDTVAAVFFNTTLRTSLSTYGIEDPELFLGAVTGPLNTMRLDQEGERQLLVARVPDRLKLEDHFRSKMRFIPKSSQHARTTILENRDGTMSVALSDSVVVIGHPADVQQYYRITGELIGGIKPSPRAAHFVDSESRAHVVTYSSDAERVRDSIIAISRAYGQELPSSFDVQIAALPYATTQTTFTGDRLVRVTRSPLGQFSALILMLIPTSSQT